MSVIVTSEPFALDLADCAALSPFTEKVIRAAVTQTVEGEWPPPLRAKVVSRMADGRPRKYVVLADDFKKWLEDLPDA